MFGFLKSREQRRQERAAKLRHQELYREGQDAGSYMRFPPRMALRGSALIFLILLGHGARADTIGNGSIAFANGDYATAMKIWKPLAEGGNAEAQAFLGPMFEEGDGVPINLIEAVKWYRKAAQAGNVDAEVSLATMYANLRELPLGHLHGAPDSSWCSLRSVPHSNTRAAKAQSDVAARASADLRYQSARDGLEFGRGHGAGLRLHRPITNRCHRDEGARV